MKRIILILTILVFAHCANKSLGTLEVSFQFNNALGDVEPSYQIAIWLEDVDSSYVKTLLLSEYLSYGGYNDSTICPEWNAKADWDKAPMEAYDAVTRATPPLGQNIIEFGLDSLGVEPGPYLCCVQAHLIEDYNILFKNPISIGSLSESSGKAVFQPKTYDGAETVLANVTTRIFKGKN